MFKSLRSCKALVLYYPVFRSHFRAAVDKPKLEGRRTWIYFIKMFPGSEITY